MPDHERLPHGWQCWVAENVLLGVTAQDIESEAEAAGMRREIVRAEIERATSDPYIEAGRWIAQRLHKLESMLQVRVEVARQNAHLSEVASCSRLPAGKFRERFYARNRPVKLLGMLDDWPAMMKWNPAYFRDNYGAQMVEICAARGGDPTYEINLEQHRRSMLLGDFTSLVTSGVGNDSYLVANNRFFEKPGMAGLLNDLGPLPGYLKMKDRAAQTYLWFGSADTITPLHHDVMNVLFCQIYGRKRVLLIAPDETPWLYNEVAVYSAVTMDLADLRRYPLFGHVAPLEVIVNPGEILFIPVGWWHHVRALDTSISVSFTNFEFPNQYHWRQPDIRRRA